MYWNVMVTIPEKWVKKQKVYRFLFFFDFYKTLVAEYIIFSLLFRVVS